MPRQARTAASELDEMVRRAMEHPGVAEAMEMYQQYREPVANVKVYLRIPQPTSIVSDSSA